MSNVYRPYKIGNEWGIIDQYGGILYDDGGGFDTLTKADFVANFHNQHPDAEWERDVMPAFNARFNPLASEPVDADAEMLQWLQSQPKGKLVSMSLEHLASLALEGDKASAPAVDAGEAVDTQKLLTAIDHLIAQNNDLQAERDDLNAAVAAAGERIDKMVNIIAIARNHLGLISRDMVGDMTPAIVAQDALTKMHTENLFSNKATPPPAPAPDVSALVEASKPFVELWRKWVVYSTDENCADSELSFWQWFIQGTTNDIKITDFRKLAAAAMLAEQGGEGENS